MQNSNIKIRSDEVQEIMSRPPSWMIRWGITLIFIIIVVFIFISWLIKYPDIIKGQATLTTIEPPVKLVVKSSGEIEQIAVLDNAIVTQNQTIASIKSTLSNEAHTFLKKEMLVVRNSFQNANLEKLKLSQTSFVFGELQTNYNALTTAIRNYSNLINKNNTAFNISNTSKQIANQKALYNLTVKQLQNTNKIIENAESKFKSDKALFEKGVISQSEFFERERIHETTLNEVQNLEKNQIQTSITITDLEKVLNDLKFNFEEQKRTLLIEIETHLGTIENALATWNRAYQITSPINGKISYLQSISTNQFIEQGRELFAIIPENQDYIAQLKIPKSGFGKVSKGQLVMIKLDNFPSNEYGQLKGKVNSVSLIPNEENYLVKVQLTNGLKTTYNKSLKYTPEMSGTAEIITEDLRITDRIFNKLRKVFE